VLTEVDYDVKVPEGFKRRYREMRSSNSTIAAVSRIFIVILYVICGIGIGLFFIIRERYLLWKRAMYWAIIVSSITILVQINTLPLSWNWYDTAVSAKSFITEQIIQAFLVSIMMGVFFWLSFMAAESLSRRAFPNHPQMWRLWSKDMGSSTEVLGLTLSGYLLVSLKIAFVLVFYFLSERFLGWWSPVGAMVEPNMLATWFPWISSFGMSLQAGFWEECLFRAIPIAGAALLGQKFGKRKQFIIVAVILQSLIFGAAHANYAQQPSYARVVEMFLPYMLYGLIYVRFGLLVGILSHFVYDVVLMSMPLFIQSSEGIWFDRMMVILLSAIPIFILLYRRVYVGKWTTLAAEHYNKSWQPIAMKAKKMVVEEIAIMTNIGSKTRKMVAIGGIIGLALYFGLNKWDNYAPMLSVSKSEAIALAESELESREIVLSDDWKRMATASSGLRRDHTFIWRTGTRDEFETLVEKGYLKSPYWQIKFARFDEAIPVDERAEEYTIKIGPNKKTISFEHSLPEAREGATLGEDAARLIAHGELKKQYNRSYLEFKEALADENKRPERKDWRFQFSDTLNYPLSEGEARINIGVSGDKNSSFYQRIEIPEEWTRDYREKQKTSRIVGSVTDLIEMLVRIAAVIFAVIFWSRKKFPVRVFLKFLIILASLKLMIFLNSLPINLAFFTTSEPFKLQMGQLLMSKLLMEFVGAFGNALIAALAYKWLVGEHSNQETDTKNSSLWWIGLSSGAIFASFSMLLSIFKPDLQPVWNTVGIYHFASAIPILGSTAFFEFYLKSTIFYMFIYAALHRLTLGWNIRSSSRKFLISLGFITVFISISGSGISSSIPYWFISQFSISIFLLVLYVVILRKNMTIIPLVFAVPWILDKISSMVKYPHPGVIQISIASIILVALLTIYWMKMLRED